MKQFLLIQSFVVMAAALINTGYNYEQPNLRQLTGISHNGINPSQHAAPVNSYHVNAPAIASQQPQFYTPPAVQLIAPPIQHAGHVQQPAVSNAHSFHQRQQQTIISKDIYIHSAPEETEEVKNVVGSAAAVPNRKNYRIVFIKAPSHNIKFNTQLIKQNQALNEEKTVIYVLSKKPDIANIQTELASVQAPAKVSKPEVYFIKYRTQEEADRAQQEIQAQYDALGGSTHISDEGFAPVTSVIGRGATVDVGSASNSQPNFLPDSFPRSQRSASSAKPGVKAV